jgi:large subunit ribosomal protein L15
MQLHSLSPRTKNKKNAPVGRGGRRGKTSGRGTKGQSSRAGHKIRPEMRDIIKKIPKLRGHGKNRSRTVKTNRVSVSAIHLSAIEMAYKVGETVSPATLLAKGLVRRVNGRAPVVKILGIPSEGGFTKALVIKNCSLSAASSSAIVAAGGTIHGEQRRTIHA